MTSMKKLLLLFVMLLPATMLNAQDVIVKKDGSTIICKVLEVGTNEVKYKKISNIDGPLYSVSITDIQNINFENGEKELFNDVSISTDFNTVNKNDVVLDYGRAIPIEIENPVRAKDVYEGQTISFRTMTNVDIDGITIIPLGTRVNGIVYKAKRSSWWGTKGKLGIRIDHLLLTDGTRIPLKGDIYVTGKNRTALSVLLFLFVTWPACFICGSKAEIQSGYDTIARLGTTVRFNKEKKTIIIDPVKEEIVRTEPNPVNMYSSNYYKEPKKAKDNGQSILDKIDGLSGKAVMVLYKGNKEMEVYIMGTHTNNRTISYKYLNKSHIPVGNTLTINAKKVKDIRFIEE